MDPSPRSSEGELPDAAKPIGSEMQVASQVMLAEYTSLRTEAGRRANVQWNVFALQVTSAGLIASLALSHTSEITLLLVIPLLSYMLGSRYLDHHEQIMLISRYIRESLSPRLGNSLAWESWKQCQSAPDAKPSSWRKTARKMLKPARLAFEGIAWLALLIAALTAAYGWRDKSAGWALILGFALLWILGALAAYYLHRSFNRFDLTSDGATSEVTRAADQTS